MKINMKLGRESAKGAPSSTDLLVCFPSRAHLALMPKPICSPARPQTEPTKRHHHPLKKSTTRGGGGGGGKASPSLWAKNKQMGSEITEPTSPKVTCAGQIKVRHGSNRNGNSCNARKNWQSVMEEIERIHNNRKLKKRSSSLSSSSGSWIESLGIKKEVMQFLTCLRNIRLDFRCFGAFPQSDTITDDDQEGDEEEEDEFDEAEEVVEGVQAEYSRTRPERNSESDDDHEGSRAVFSKWFMVLQENQESNNLYNEDRKQGPQQEESGCSASSVPPPNALLLMRCRSAPAKSWLQKRRHQDQEHEDEEEEREEIEIKEEGVKRKGKNLRDLMDEEKRCSVSKNLLVMKYKTDMYKFSTDIAKETWVVGGIKDPLSRSRSWKR